MQANKFVEKFGWNDARVCILNCACPEDRWLMRHGEFISDDAFDDLKRLVESWELIESLGGLVKAKTNLSSVEFNLSKSVWFGEDKLEKQDFASKLRQAIADVESCQ